jgi:hypothetical protein
MDMRRAAGNFSVLGRGELGFQARSALEEEWVVKDAGGSRGRRGCGSSPWRPFRCGRPWAQGLGHRFRRRPGEVEGERVLVRGGPFGDDVGDDPSIVGRRGVEGAADGAAWSASRTQFMKKLRSSSNGIAVGIHTPTLTRYPLYGHLPCPGRLERGEQCLECCLVGPDEWGCLRREQDGLE